MKVNVVSIAKAMPPPIMRDERTSLSPPVTPPLAVKVMLAFSCVVQLSSTNRYTDVTQLSFHTQQGAGCNVYRYAYRGR